MVPVVDTFVVLVAVRLAAEAFAAGQKDNLVAVTLAGTAGALAEPALADTAADID